MFCKKQKMTSTLFYELGDAFADQWKKKLNKCQFGKNKKYT